MKPNVPIKNRLLNGLNAREKVLEILFQYPEGEFSLSDLAKKSCVAKANIGKILGELEREEIISIEKLSKIWRIRANVDSPHYNKQKIVHNLDLIYKSGLTDFLIDHFDNPKAIVLFGSFRKGEDLSESDIDIAIESGNGESGYEIIKLKELSKFEKNIGRKIQIHIFQRNKVEKNLFNNIVNGIVLSGHLEVG